MKSYSPQRRNGGVFDVVSYKADPTGTNDSTSAFQAAWDAANTYASTTMQATLLIPPGRYKIQGRVTAKSNVDVSAYGAVIFGGTDYNSAGGAGSIMFMTAQGTGYTGGASNVTIRGGIWDAKGQSAPTDGVRDIFCPSNGVNWQFIDCIFRNVPTWHAIDANAISGLSVQNCRFEGFVDKTSGGTSSFREAIQLDTGGDGTPCKNVTVTGCYMGPSPDGSGLGGFGKLVGSHNPTVANTGPHLGVTVTGCVIDDAKAEALGFYYTSQLTITGNTIRGPAKSGIKIYGSGSSRIAITGNTVTTAGEHGIFVGDASNVRVNGNNIDFVTLSGIQVDNTIRAAVDGNSIYDAGQRGIWIANATTKSTITNNTVIGAGRGTNATYGGIEISAYQNNDNLITGNRIGRTGSSGTNFAIKPIHFASSNTSTGVQIANNSFDGFSSYPSGSIYVNHVDVSESTTSGTYTSLSTVDSLTVVTGTAALVSWTAEIGGSNNNAATFLAIDVSGATTIAASDDDALRYDATNEAGSSQVNNYDVRERSMLYTNLTPGENTFTIMYKTSGSDSVSFNHRHIKVTPIAL